jgi:hypothetical protein
LVLLSVTPDGTKPLTEVTDPQEVDRLLGLCHQANDNSTTAEFQDVLARMSREPTSPGFLGNSSAASYTSDAYVRRPGGGSHA